MMATPKPSTATLRGRRDKSRRRAPFTSKQALLRPMDMGLIAHIQRAFDPHSQDATGHVRSASFTLITRAALLALYEKLQAGMSPEELRRAVEAAREVR